MGNKIPCQLRQLDFPSIEKKVFISTTLIEIRPKSLTLVISRKLGGSIKLGYISSLDVLGLADDHMVWQKLSFLCNC